MTTRLRGWLLPPASLLLVAGVFLGRENENPVFPLAACGLALIAVILLTNAGRFLALMVFSIALGTLAGTFAFHPSLPAEDDYNIRGIISDEVTDGSFGQVRVYLSDIRLNGRSFPSGAYWTFYTDEHPADLLPGKAVSFRASLYHPRGAVNPDGYNQRETLLQRGISIGLYGYDSLTVSEPDFFSFHGSVASLRHRLSGALTDTLGEETGAYASALLLGMRSLVSSGDRQAFSRLGIAHILSVSGFHVGVLIGALMALFRLLRLRPGIRLLLSAVILFLYAALCGMNQPVIRASLLLLLGQEGRILNRPRSGIHLLSAALFVMTLLSPVQVTSASFQLTFCAVFGLTWFAPLARRIRPFRSRFPRRIFESAVLLFGVQLALLFPELLYFQRIPLLVFLTALPAMLVSGMLISLFWIVLLLLPFPGLAALLSAPLSAVTGFLLTGIRRLGSLPGLTLWVHVPTVLTAAGIILLFIGFCCFVRISALPRAVLLASGTALLVVSLLPFSHSGTEYIQLSAGNADAAVLWDRDQVWVFDTGEDDGTLSGFLRTRRLIPDAVVLTHLHTDHAGGLRSLLDEEIPVRLLLLPEGAEKQNIHPDVLAMLEEMRQSGTTIRYLSRGDEILLPSGTFSVLWPESGKTRPGQDANHYSLVSRLVLNGTVLLHTGDVSGTYELYSAVPADVLKVAHHGSASSTAPAFLDTVSPAAAVLSCQRLSRLQDVRDRMQGISVWGTPESGAVTVRFDKDAFTVLPYIPGTNLPEENNHETE